MSNMPLIRALTTPPTNMGISIAARSGYFTGIVQYGLIKLFIGNGCRLVVPLCFVKCLCPPNRSCDHQICNQKSNRNVFPSQHTQAGIKPDTG